MSHQKTFDTGEPHSRDKKDLPETNFTLRHAPYAYIHLVVKEVPSTSNPLPLDNVTVHTYLRSALSQFLGLTGTAITLDLLKIDGRDVWVRVAKDDASAVIAAVSQWANANQGMSMQVKASGNWLGAVIARGRLDKLWTLET